MPEVCVWVSNGAAGVAVVIGFLSALMIQWVKNKRSNVNLRSRPEFLNDASKTGINVVISLILPFTPMLGQILNMAPQSACSLTISAYIWTSMISTAILVGFQKFSNSRSQDQLQHNSWSGNDEQSDRRTQVRELLIWFLTVVLAQALTAAVVGALVGLTQWFVSAFNGVVGESVFGQIVGMTAMAGVTMLHVILMDERLMKRAPDYSRVNAGDVDTELNVFGEEEFGDLEDAFENK